MLFVALQPEERKVILLSKDERGRQTARYLLDPVEAMILVGLVETCIDELQAKNPRPVKYRRGKRSDLESDHPFNVGIDRFTKKVGLFARDAPRAWELELPVAITMAQTIRRVVSDIERGQAPLGPLDDHEDVENMESRAERKRPTEVKERKR